MNPSLESGENKENEEKNGKVVRQVRFANERINDNVLPNSQRKERVEEDKINDGVNQKSLSGSVDKFGKLDNGEKTYASVLRYVW